MTTGVTTMNLTGAENGPVFAPSWARALQKYVRSLASLSGSRIAVRPSLPGVTPSLENTRVAKPASAATSTR